MLFYFQEKIGKVLNKTKIFLLDMGVSFAIAESNQKSSLTIREIQL